MNLKKMTDQFCQFQLERRRRRFKNMTTFIRVNVQLGENNRLFLANVIVNQGIAITIIATDPNYLQGRDVIIYEDMKI
jgi:CYTH domain-containing protein